MHHFKRLWNGKPPDDSNDAQRGRPKDQRGQSTYEATDMARINAQLQQRYDEASEERARMTRELVQYREMVENWKLKAQNQASKIGAQQSAAQEQQRELTESLKTNQQLCKDKEKLSVELSETSRRITVIQDELLKQQEQVKRWKEHNNAFANEVQKLSKELDEAKKRTESVTAKLQTVQIEALKQVQPSWVATDDSRVREASDNLHAKIRSWAKKYSATSMRESLAKLSGNFAAFLHYFQPLASFRSWESLVDFKHPFLIVFALVSEYLRANLLENPFKLLSFNGENGAITNEGYCLNIIYQKLMKENFPRAQEFRTQLLRTFFPQSRIGQIGLDSSLINPEVPTRVYTQITMTFFHWFTPFLGVDDISVRKCYDELLQIVSETGTLGSHLGTQRTSYIWQSAASQLGKEFAVSSPYVKADRLNRLDDEEDDKCDGNPIGIILGPALTAFGNSDGENYEKSRVLTKASVWVDDRNAFQWYDTHFR